MRGPVLRLLLLTFALTAAASCRLQDDAVFARTIGIIVERRAGTDYLSILVRPGNSCGMWFGITPGTTIKFAAGAAAPGDSLTVGRIVEVFFHGDWDDSCPAEGGTTRSIILR